MKDNLPHSSLMEKLGIEEKIIYRTKNMKKYYYNYYYSLAKMPKTLIYYVMHMNAGRSL